MECRGAAPAWIVVGWLQEPGGEGGNKKKISRQSCSDGTLQPAYGRAPNSNLPPAPSFLHCSACLSCLFRPVPEDQIHTVFALTNRKRHRQGPHARSIFSSPRPCSFSPHGYFLRPRVQRPPHHCWPGVFLLARGVFELPFFLFFSFFFFFYFFFFFFLCIAR